MQTKLLHRWWMALVGIACLPTLLLSQSAGYPEASFSHQVNLSDKSDPLASMHLGECNAAANIEDCLLKSTRSVEQTKSVPSSLSREQQALGPQPQESQVVEPPSEFQKFVQTSTGHLLPIYGTSLFDRVPTTFLPLDRIPIAPEYVVGPGDDIDVRIWGQVNFNERLTVDRAGEIFIPQVGRVSVAGLRFDQLQEVIKSNV